MANNCGQNKTSSVNPNCNPIADYCNTGCLDITPTDCLIFSGATTQCLEIGYGTTVTTVIEGFDKAICLINDELGKVKTDPTDECYGYLIDKLEAGSNIVISGVGTGCQKKIKIDSVIGGIQEDEKVKVSAQDSVTGFLETKIIAGDCLIISKSNPGLNEKLKIDVDWQCVLNKLSTLPGFCTLVTNCVGVISPQECPDITLNSPIISGPNVSLSWTSTATQFNVYLDGQLQPGSPQSSTSFSKTGLINGSHTIEVIATCLVGTPKSKTTTFLVNTNCPSPSNISTSYAGGNVTISWTPGGGINSVSQSVKYRLKGTSAWTVPVSGLSAGTSTYTINGISNNKIYEYVVVNVCLGGGETESSIFESINIVCPTVTFTPTDTTIAYSFANVANDVTQYLIEILDSSGSTIVDTHTVNPPFTSNITGTFSGLVAATQYQYRLTIKAQSLQKVCPAQFVTTENPPTCPLPTNLNVTVN